MMLDEIYEEKCVRREKHADSRERTVIQFLTEQAQRYTHKQPGVKPLANQKATPKHASLVNIFYTNTNILFIHAKETYVKYKNT